MPEAIDESRLVADDKTLDGTETDAVWDEEAASVEVARRRRAQMADNLELRMRAMAARSTGCLQESRAASGTGENSDTQREGHFIPLGKGD